MPTPRSMSVSSLPGEAQLLLLAAGGPSTHPGILRLLGGELDWNRLCHLAELEQAAPVLVERLRRLQPSLDPGTGLRRMAQVMTFNQHLLRQRLYRTLDALDAAGMDVVLLKGAGLAHSAYARFTDRPMADIDLLVAPEFVAPAREVLLASGWIHNRDRRPEDVYRDHHHLPPLDDAAGAPISIELHTDICLPGHPFRLPPEAVRRQARRIQVEGRTILVPDVHHQLLHACIHFAWGHQMTRGAWRTFRDLVAIAGTGQVDWDRFVELARESRGTTCCFWTLHLARAVAEVEVPESVMQALRPQMTELLLRTLERHFTLSLLPTAATCPSVRLRNFMWRLGMQPERSGHGSALPWRGSRRNFHRAAPPGRRFASAVQRLARHASHAVHSPRYLLSLR